MSGQTQHEGGRGKILTSETTPPLNPLPTPQGGDLTPPRRFLEQHLATADRGQGGEVNNYSNSANTLSPVASSN